MPQRDKYHETVRNALTKDGWSIVSDPMILRLDGGRLYIDLEAEKQDDLDIKIAIEVKVLSPTKFAEEVEKALGQYIIYRGLLELYHPTHTCYLAVPDQAYQKHLRKPDFQYILASNQIHLLIFNEREEIVQWIN